MIDAETLDRLLSPALHAAEKAGFDVRHQGPIAQIKAGLVAALQMLEANGLIEVVPRDKWPKYVVIDPPYDLGDARG